VGDAVGDTLFSGRGAGMMPTASAMVSDLIGLAVDPGNRVRQTAELWRPEGNTLALADPDGFRTRAYLRFQIPDRPGELAHLARILGDNGISIASVIQHEPMEAERLQDSVPLVIMTHSATTGAMHRALDEITRTCRLRAEPVFLEVNGHTGG
jgi:homoserine dehydrogenase